MLFVCSLSRAAARDSALHACSLALSSVQQLPHCRLFASVPFGLSLIVQPQPCKSAHVALHFKPSICAIPLANTPDPTHTSDIATATTTVLLAMESDALVAKETPARKQRKNQSKYNDLVPGPSDAHKRRKEQNRLYEKHTRDRGKKPVKSKYAAHPTVRLAKTPAERRKALNKLYAANKNAGPGSIAVDDSPEKKEAESGPICPEVEQIVKEETRLHSLLSDLLVVVTSCQTFRIIIVLTIPGGDLRHGRASPSAMRLVCRVLAAYR